jgi:hypothetical protein
VRCGAEAVFCGIMGFVLVMLCAEKCNSKVLVWYMQYTVTGQLVRLQITAVILFVVGSFKLS